MPARQNYRFERFERERLKKAKKEEKLRRQQERTVQPPGDRDDIAPSETALPES